MGLVNAEKFSYGELNEKERNVIINKATDKPYSGKYDNFYENGLYCCRKCGTPLYTSDAKFDAGCGWPSFESEIPDAVKTTPDPDGFRTEISCAKCKAHLGHIFKGEKLSPADVRHCVNSTSLVFENQETGRLRRAVFAGGCFWGVEAMMKPLKGVVQVISGYAGGDTPAPNYKQVSSGKTGHLEAVEIIYDSVQTNFSDLCKYFLEIHDPTQLNRQGPDVGSQYASAIFYLNQSQKIEAQNLLNVLLQNGYNVQTRLIPFGRFYPAESYHQNYYQKNNKTPYCHSYTKRF